MTDRQTADLLQLRYSLVHIEFWRFVLAAAALVAIGIAASILTAYSVSAQQWKISWEIVSLLGFSILCFSLPLFQKIDLSKDKTSIEMARPVEMIEKMILEKSAEAETARGQVFEELEQRIKGLSLQLTEISARLGPTPRESGNIGIAAEESGPADGDAEPSLDELRRRLPAVIHPDDPQKGRFGGAEEVAGRRLSARVEPSAIGKQWRKVTLTVATLDRRPLAGRYAYFFVHDTLQPDVYRAVVNSTGTMATMSFQSYGAFTVGAIVDRGETLLELDLACSRNVTADDGWRAR